MQKIIALSLICITLITACGTKQGTSQNEANKMYAPPTVPAIIADEQEGHNWSALHYWDNFDFADTTLISKAEMTEQAFVNFIDRLNYVGSPIIEKGVAAMLGKASVDSAMYNHFRALAEQYLYDPNSPMRNEDIYIVVLRSIIDNAKLDDINKERPRHQLKMALKNRVGDLAIDFTYITEEGDKATLYGVAGDPLLLFFFKPDCPTCHEVKEYVQKNGLDKKVEILYVDIDKNTDLDAIYDLRASPTLYLLDRGKRVILKDALIGQVEQYLDQTKEQS